MPSKRISVREGRQLSLLGGYAGRLNANDSTWNFANLITPNLNDTACGLTPSGLENSNSSNALENGNSSNTSSTITGSSFMDSSDNTQVLAASIVQEQRTTHKDCPENPKNKQLKEVTMESCSKTDRTYKIIVKKIVTQQLS